MSAGGRSFRYNQGADATGGAFPPEKGESWEAGVKWDLASRLTGWQLNVMTAEQVQAKSEAEQAAARQLFMDKLEVDEEIAGILVSEGFSTVEEIAYVPVGELLAVEGFDEDIVEELRARARDALLNEALAAEEKLEENQPAEDLLELPGMTEAVAYALAERGIRTRDELADLATDELTDITGPDAGRGHRHDHAGTRPLVRQ